MRHAPVLLAFGLLAATGCAPRTETTEPADVTTASSKEAPASANPDDAANVPAATTAESDEAKAKLAFATMEDGYMNDGQAQWAVSATASSSYGSANDEPMDSDASYTPWQATGGVNGESWSNGQQDIGFDWLQLEYERPVHATAVRAVLNDEAVRSITRVELIDTDGTAHAMWNGVSDTAPDRRGRRTWFVRQFEPTAFETRAVKLTFANPVSPGYKYVDAVQLVGK